MTDNNAPGLSGEDRLRSRRMKFWRYLAIVMVGFMIAGFFSGYAKASFDSGDLPIWVPLVLGAITGLALIWFTWDYFRRVDELDLMDNLWSHLIGQYAAGLTFMGWYLLGELGITTYPTAVGIVFVMIGSTFVAYGLRKLGLR